jgi:hypothetical protein
VYTPKKIEDNDDDNDGKMIIPLAELERMEKLIHTLEIVITILRYLPIIIGVLAAISLVLAAFNFVDKSYGWAVVNLLLGLAGVSFVLGVTRRRPRHFAKPSDVAH